MPQYRNISKITKVLNGKIIQPNENINSLIYFEEDGVELCKIKEDPYYNPILLSKKIIQNCDIKIPERDEFKNWLSKYSIHFYIQKGEVEIFFNSIHNIPSLKLYNDARWNIRCLERKIDKVIIKGEGTFILWIIIERL